MRLFLSCGLMVDENYIFDVEWVKINGIWNYRHTLLDTCTKEILAEGIYKDETRETVEEFLKNQHSIKTLNV